MQKPNTAQRIKLLATALEHPTAQSLLGSITEQNLTEWLTAELGNAEALEKFIPCGDITTKAVAPETCLHIVSGNTPHAAMQSCLRGLLLGSHNIIKMPSHGLPDFQSWIDDLPPELKSMVDLVDQIEDYSIADVVIAIGADDTIRTIHHQLTPRQKFIPHGHKVSIALVTGDLVEAAKLAAKDVSLYDQQGCLSPHAVYLTEGQDAQKFGELLAEQIELLNNASSDKKLSLSEAGAIRNWRETSRFQTSNDPNNHSLWESADNLHWTIFFENSPTLKLSCLNCCIYIKPWPEHDTIQELGAEAQHLSTIALHPFCEKTATKLSDLPAHRICPLGKSQQPSLFWHHDGCAPLASMVTWKDIC